MKTELIYNRDHLTKTLAALEYLGIEYSVRYFVMTLQEYRKLYTPENDTTANGDRITCFWQLEYNKGE